MKTFCKILTIALFIISCTSPNEEVNVSDIDITTKIDRFDQELFEVKDEASMRSLQSRYPVFFEIFVKNIIGIAEVNDPALGQYLNSFTNDSYIQEVNRECQKVHQDFTEIEAQFSDAFKRYEHYFPEKIVPRIVSFMSGFSYTIVVDDSLLSFGVDMYLGSDCAFYPRLGIPKYKFTQMNRENIVSDAMKGWISTEYDLSKQDYDLLNLMIYHGKLLYALDKLLPASDDYTKAGFTKEQIQWCHDNEAEVWFHFIDRNLLYSKDNAVFTKYMNEGPFTPGFPEGSPGQIGKWVGWQIVRNYMTNNPTITLQQLMENKVNAVQILNQSKYKPKR